jgi:hypothetical protein
VKGYKVLKFRINNNDISSFGYKFFKDDESIGVKALCIYGDYAYFTDVYHNNIKRVNLITDSIKVSDELRNGDTAIWLRDICVFNDSVFVTSDGGYVYVFSKDLNHYKEVSALRGIQGIDKLTKDSLIISNAGTDENNLITITKNGIHQVRSKQSSVIHGTLQKDTVEYAIDKPFKKYETKGKWYLQNQFGIIPLNEPIPQITEYGCENVDFSGKYLVYYNSTPELLELYVYTLRQQ